MFGTKFDKDEMGLLEAFGIEISYHVINNENDMPIAIVACGGLEVLREAKRDDEIRKMMEDFGESEYGIIRDDTKLLPFMYVDGNFNVHKLRELLEHKSKDTYSKKEAIKLGYKEKSELEDEIVYVTKKTPSTNSLALSKQFGLEHKIVIRDLLKLGSERPHTLMQMGYKIYRDIIKQRNRGSNTETVGNTRPVQDRTGLTNTETREIYSSYLEITEDVYYSFVQNMGRPKSKEMTIFRNVKKDEYFTAFKKVREFLYNSGVKRDELESMMKRRTHATSELIGSIYDFITRHNKKSYYKNIALIDANRFTFNLINYVNGINAIEYIPQTEKEYKLCGTRKTKDDIIQQQLLEMEIKLTTGFTFAKKFDIPFQDVIMTSLNINKDEALKYLKEYGVEELLELTKHEVIKLKD